LQSFQSQAQNVGSSSKNTKIFSQNRKMSINQMKTVHNLDSTSDAMTTVEKTNYASFHGNKQTSFRQSYTGVGSTSNTFHHYNPPQVRNANMQGPRGEALQEGVATHNIQNYSSMTNSSNKTSSRKDFQSLNALKGNNSRSSSLSQSKSISRKKGSPRK
jgi:hypothetical protein